MRNFLQETLQYLEEHENSSLLKVVAFPLLVLSWCYGFILDLRWVFEEFKAKVSVPSIVVCVGNMTVGGTGKTPVVAWIAQFLDQRKVKVGVVSHGYGAVRRRSFLILREQKPSAAVSSLAGDEAVLLSHMLGRIPIATGKKKGFVVVRTWRTVRPKVIVIDDGFQSISIRRDLDIVIVDATNPWGNGHLLPRGRLRERKENLSRGDIVILTRCNQSNRVSELVVEIQRLTSAPIVKAEHIIRGVWEPDTWNEARLEALNGASVYAFSAIANPESFEHTLREAGARLVGSMRFSDHYFFSHEDLEEIEKRASLARAELLATTEKDAMRLPDAGKWRGRIPLLAIGIKLRIAEGAETIQASLLNLLASRGAEGLKLTVGPRP